MKIETVDFFLSVDAGGRRQLPLRVTSSGASNVLVGAAFWTKADYPLAMTLLVLLTRTRLAIASFQA